MEVNYLISLIDFQVVLQTQLSNPILGTEGKSVIYKYKNRGMIECPSPFT